MKNSPYHPRRKLYTSELDIDEEHIDAFVNWYAFRHAPDIYQIGFDVCTSYRGIAGTMTILDLYEIDSVDIFDTPQYGSIAQTDPYAAGILAKRRSKAHTGYSQAFVAPEPVNARAPLGTPVTIMEKLHAAITLAINGKPYRERMAQAEGEIPSLSIAEAKKFVDEDAVMWATLIRSLDLKLNQ